MTETTTTTTSPPEPKPAVALLDRGSEHTCIYRMGVRYHINGIYNVMYFNVSRQLPNGKIERSTIVCPLHRQAELAALCVQAPPAAPPREAAAALRRPLAGRRRRAGAGRRPMGDAPLAAEPYRHALEAKAVSEQMDKLSVEGDQSRMGGYARAPASPVS
jgi:hypothetical protein